MVPGRFRRRVRGALIHVTALGPHVPLSRAAKRRGASATLATGGHAHWQPAAATEGAASLLLLLQAAGTTPARSKLTAVGAAALSLSTDTQWSLGVSTCDGIANAR